MAELDDRLLGLLNSMGPDATARMLQMDVNRGVVPGSKTPGTENLSPEQLALMDRYAWGQQSGLGALPTAAVYEGLKGVSQLPGMGSVLPAVAKAIGFEDTGKQFQQDQTSSPASLNNLLTVLKGARSAGEQSLPGMLAPQLLIGESGTSSLANALQKLMHGQN